MLMAVFSDSVVDSEQHFQPREYESNHIMVLFLHQTEEDTFDKNFWYQLVPNLSRLGLARSHFTNNNLLLIPSEVNSCRSPFAGSFTIYSNGILLDTDCLTGPLYPVKTRPTRQVRSSESLNLFILYTSKQNSTGPQDFYRKISTYAL